MRDPSRARVDSTAVGPRDSHAAGVATARVSAATTQPRAASERHNGSEDAILDLIPIVRRVIAARVRDHQIVDDLVQETLARMMVARGRLDPDALVPYAVAIGRNLVIAAGQGEDRARRTAHLLAQDGESHSTPPDDAVFRREEISVIGTALARLAPAERDVLLAHEVDGTGTAKLAADRGSSAGAIAAQLSRTRAKLRVEYLLADTGVDLANDRCRPVLFALSAGDRRRQRELDAAGHLLSCDDCLALSADLFERRPQRASEDEARVRVAVDADVVRARQLGREIAARAGFSATELTVIATAISEIARNIVKFTARGEIVISLVDEQGRSGVRVVARDAGPGIKDVRGALRDGVSTYQGLGLGLPGARRLMDDFDIMSEVGKGTTVTMAKWR